LIVVASFVDFKDLKTTNWLDNQLEASFGNDVSVTG
jgi:hypothetical protein